MSDVVDSTESSATRKGQSWPVSWRNIAIALIDPGAGVLSANAVGVEKRNTRLVVNELERVDLGKMNLQFIANEENQDRAQCGKNEAGGMISFVCRARKHVGNGAADDRSDNAEHDRPEDRHMHMHHRSRDKPRD